MRIILYFLALICFTSCLNDNAKKSEKQIDNLTVEEKEIIQTFSVVDSLLKSDNGNFWGKQLYGSIILVDPISRIFYSNENNPTNDFKQIRTIFSDSLPANITIANTAINWNNKRWSMVMLPLPKDKNTRNNLIIHELYHRLQPEIGFGNIKELDNKHLDTYRGRLLLKLELEALEKGLSSNDEKLKMQHVQNALIFRNKRHENKEIKNAENSLELNEGLAEYTAIMLSGRDGQKMTTHFTQSKRDFYTNPTFVRSFAYQTIPLYGYMLASKNKQWHRAIDSTTNLTDYFNKSFQATLETEKSSEEIAIEFKYNYLEIKEEETKRENARLENIKRLKVKFFENAILELAFKNMNISFDPRNITPLDNLGTVYPNIKVTDDWGILTVNNEALLASDWSNVKVTAPTEITTKIVKGDGWELELNPKWQVKEIDNTFKLALIKE